MRTRGLLRLGVLGLLAALLTIAIVEIIAYAALRAMHVYPDKPFREMYATSACLNANEFNFPTHGEVRRDNQVMIGRVPHPFFGFVLNQEGTTIEYRRQQIGPDFENQLRYSIALGKDPRPADTFTVGIFGASVAVSFAEHVLKDDRFAVALRERVPSLKDRQIVVRNMAIGASRQPAQFAIATQYMDLLDMTINLDGYSEQAISMYPDYPIEYPMFGDVFFNKDGAPRYLELRAVESVCDAISAPGQSSLLRHSNTYYLFWYVVSAYLKQNFHERTQVPAESVEKFAFSDDEVRRLYASYYERFTRYQHQVLTANGVRAYFFLQPNQYVRDSKTFSEEEQRTAIHARDAAETAERYALLRQTIRDLAAAGVAAFDLTPVFSKVPETIYVDPCCHVNDRGNQLIAEAVIDAIARTERAGGL